MGGGVKSDGFKGSSVVGSCLVSATFGEGVMINGFSGVEVVTLATAIDSCIMVGKLSSG